MSPQPALRSDDRTATGRRKSQPWWWIAAVRAAGACGAGVYWHYRLPPPDAVIVRPFADETGQPWLAGAITEEIVDALRPAMKANADPSRTAILDGTVARAGGNLRITVALS